MTMPSIDSRRKTRRLAATVVALAMLIAIPFAFVAGLTDIHDAPPTLQRR